MQKTVSLHFHPDWPYENGTVLDAMVRTGTYRSQFETGTSNGGLTAYPGGARWTWESQLFSRRYDADTPGSRPVYGALASGDDYGPAPRFGSAYFQLRQSVLKRTTFCYPDSAFGPERVVGLEGVDHLLKQMKLDCCDALDRYVEAHIHGGVSLSQHVEALVLDPCFEDSETHATARRLGCRIAFHSGYRLPTHNLDPAYRGNDAVVLARSLGPFLTPDLIGRAAQSGKHDPQTLKRVWHHLARFGRRNDRRQST